MSEDRGKILSFHQSGEQLRRKAKAAVLSGDIPRALKLYRTAIEQNPDDQQLGLAYASLLYQNSCWRASLRESCRLLCRFPAEEKYYGLIYRNLLALGEDRSACTAYERYMLHLYHHPEDGLSLNEEMPPIPEKPPKSRYYRLLARIRKSLDHQDYDKANELLMHANRDTFPDEDPVRDVLEIEVMLKIGLEQDAYSRICRMMDEGRLDAHQAIGLIGPTVNEFGGELTARLLLYATAVAQSPKELYAMVRACIISQQTNLAISAIESILHEEPYRVDALYNLAMAYIHAGNLRTAAHYIGICYQVDPADADVDVLYRILMDSLRLKKDAKEIQQLPIPLFGNQVTMSGIISRRHYAELLRNPDEAARELVKWSEVNRLMNTLPRIAPLHEELAACSEKMEPHDRNTFLRIMLLTASPSRELAEKLDSLIRNSGDFYDIPVNEGGRLKIRSLRDLYNR